MKYDSRFGDAFWNSSDQSYFRYLLQMMTSWALICHVWYLPLMTKEVGKRKAKLGHISQSKKWLSWRKKARVARVTFYTGTGYGLGIDTGYGSVPVKPVSAQKNTGYGLRARENPCTGPARVRSLQKTKELEIVIILYFGTTSIWVPMMPTSSAMAMPAVPMPTKTKKAMATETAPTRLNKDASDSEDTDYEHDLNYHFTCVRDGQFEELVVRVRNALTRRKRPKIDSLRLWRCAVDERTVPDNQAAMPPSTSRALPTTWPIESRSKARSDKKSTSKQRGEPKLLDRYLNNCDHPTVKTDFLIAHATFAHFVSWRHHQYGTYFVQSLVEVLSKRTCQEDILNMMTRVNDLVGKLCAGPPDHQMQTPVVGIIIRKTSIQHLDEQDQYQQQEFQFQTFVNSRGWQGIRDSMPVLRRSLRTK
ncbi:hypothetical protein niasHT_027751 [Heterodera trifolii]|uniref:Caspase family p10 domain-containing protein n=1 Tax=Heterodera trifolii TaxID=157864 RepID=A0ABD2KJ27_9BILA